MLLSNGRSSTPDQDRWHRQYVSKSPSSTPRHTPTTSSDVTGLLKATSPTKAPKHLCTPDGQRPPLRALSSTRDTASANRSEMDLNVTRNSPDLASQGYEQGESEDETITRAFGSVLDPETKRQKWSCAVCSVMFVRVSLRASLYGET